MALKRSLFAVLSFPVLAFASIHVVDNTESRCTFEFSMNGLSVEGRSRADEEYTRISFDGANTDLGAAGEIVMPAMSVQVGVPAEGEVRVSFASISVERVSLTSAPPRRHEESRAYENGAPVFRNPWISQAHYVRVGGSRIARMVLRPFLYDEKTRTLTILKRGTCTIEFPSTTAFPRARSVAHPDFERVLRDLLINYDVAKNWVVDEGRGIRKRAAKTVLSPRNIMLEFTIGDGHSGTNEGTTLENGMVKITGSQLGSLYSGTIPIDAVSLYASYKKELSSSTPDSVETAIPAGAIHVPVVRVDNNSNGYFDSDDYLIACVSGTSDWFWDTVANRYEFVLNRFDDYRHYWLAVTDTGSTAATFGSSAVAADTVTRFTDRIMYRKATAIEDKHEGGTKWIWRKLSGSPSVFDVRMKLGAPANSGDDSLRVLSSNLTGDDSLNVTVGGADVCKGCATDSWNHVSSWGNQIATLEYFNRSGNSGSFMEIKAIEVKYDRQLTLGTEGFLRILSPPDSGLVAYKLTGLPAEKVYVMRIPVDESKTSLVGVVPAAGSTFTWSDTTGIGIQYFVCAESALKTGLAMEMHPARSNSGYRLVDLRATGNSCDFLIISHEDFLTEADRLAMHKYTTGRFKTPRVVDLDDIYDQFAGGVRDPGAIRNFLVYARYVWGGNSPEYVILMGSGHYDYKGYATTETNHIPPAEFNDKCIEDFFGYLNPGEAPTGGSASSSTPDIFIGRLTCVSLSEAAGIVDKIIEIEGDQADRGAWRNRVLLVADDDMQGSKVDPISSSSAPHHESSEKVETIALEARPSLDVRKVYLFDYEWNEFYEKPEAHRALVNEINNGVGYVNYFGHGADNLWADERVLSIESIGNLTNRRRYPIVSSFSCSVGRFDQPGSDCLSGELVNAPGAGAIAAVSSTRKAFASENDRLAQSFFGYLFEPDIAPTVGQALVHAKMQNLNNNEKTYCILGDPSIRLSTFTDSVALTVTDMGGDEIDSIMALQQVKIHGKVYRNGVLNTSFGTSGSPAGVQLGLYNPPTDSARRKDKGKDNSVFYSLPGNPVFIGQTSFTNGSFEQTVQIPRNLFFDTQGVRLVAYAYKDTLTGTGLKKNVIFHGTDTVDVTDKSGPRIAVRPIYDASKWNAAATFTDEITAILPLECEILVYDENGVDVVGTGPDEGLSIEVTGSLAKQNINHKFQFAEGDFRQGKAAIAFMEDDLKVGKHQLIISAQDLLGNNATAEVELHVIDAEDFKLGRVFNYPNPFRMGQSTKFYFYHSNVHADNAEYSWYGQVAAVIRIYTLSGRLLRVIKNAENGHVWDGTDEFGNQLSPNVYLYRVSATLDLGQTEKSELSRLKKLVIKPPR